MAVGLGGRTVRTDRNMVRCNGQARRLAANAGVTAEEALKEWTANLIPGVTVIPSGTWGVNRAQEAGCTYCYAG